MLLGGNDITGLLTSSGWLKSWSARAAVAPVKSPGRAAGWPSDRRYRGGRGRNVVGDVRGVGADEAQQCRSPGVLPWQAEEVQPGNRTDAPPVDRCACGVGGAGDAQERV